MALMLSSARRKVVLVFLGCVRLFKWSQLFPLLLKLSLREEVTYILTQLKHFAPMPAWGGGDRPPFSGNVGHLKEPAELKRQPVGQAGRQGPCGQLRLLETDASMACGHKDPFSSKGGEPDECGGSRATARL